jgi:hypothetical protein
MPLWSSVVQTVLTKCRGSCGATSLAFLAELLGRGVKCLEDVFILVFVTGQTGASYSPQFEFP